MVVSILSGCFLWILMEYFIHRYLGHVWKIRTPFKKEHQTHHAKKDFFAPIYLKIIAAVIVVGSLLLIGLPKIFAISFTTMYLFYEWTHYSFHKFKPISSWGRKQRKHHFYHHFMNSNQNFGVTTSIFDKVFSTYQSTDQSIRVPKLFLMNWLKDSEYTISEKFKTDYETS